MRVAGDGRAPGLEQHRRQAFAGLLAGWCAVTSASEITAALNGKWSGHHGLACCPAHDDRRPSLSISEGRDGRLLLHCYAGCDFRRILDALRGLGLVQGSGRIPVPDLVWMARRKERYEAQAQRKAQRAVALWHASQPIAGTIAERYLRGRGIICDLPDCLRFHPMTWHPSGGRFPAMLARVEGNERFGMHRTFLAPDGAGKATIEPTKAMLGSMAGGAVRLTTGGDRLVVAEGIETALSLASGLLNGRASIWAALSTSGLAGLRLPKTPGRLIVATDGDDAGAFAGHRLAERAHAAGWTVSVLPAPEGQDWNDILTSSGAKA